MLFSNTRDTAELLGNRLKGGIFGLNVEVYHGSLSKERREGGVEELMRGGKGGCRGHYIQSGAGHRCG